MREILKSGLILMVVAAMSAGALSIVNEATEDRIKTTLKQEELTALVEVLPQAKVFDPVREGRRIFYYIGYGAEDREILVGYACVAEGEGYSSTIETMVGITTDGEILGLKVLSHNETPGLGARIEEVKSSKTLNDFWSWSEQGDQGKPEEKPWFQKQFIGKGVKDLYIEKMDGISGATISSKAIIDSVREKIKAVLIRVREKEE